MTTYFLDFNPFRFVFLKRIDDRNTIFDILRRGNVRGEGHGFFTPSSVYGSQNSSREFIEAEDFLPVDGLLAQQYRLLEFENVTQAVSTILKRLYDGLVPSKELVEITETVFGVIPSPKPDKSQLELATVSAICEKKDACTTSVVFGDSKEASHLAEQFERSIDFLYRSKPVTLKLAVGKIKTLLELIGSEEFRWIFPDESIERMIENYSRFKAKEARLEREADLRITQCPGAVLSHEKWETFLDGTVRDAAINVLRELIARNAQEELNGRHHLRKEVTARILARLTKGLLAEIKTILSKEGLSFGEKQRRHFEIELQNLKRCLALKLESALKDAFVWRD